MSPAPALRRILLLSSIALAAGGARGVSTAAEEPGVPVVVGEVVQRDVPTYLMGLGKVQALNTVTIRPQVEGQIVAVAFKEGQDVRAGDLLFQIDPQSYDAALQAALGKRAQDEAQLEYARKVLARNKDLLGKGMVDQQAFEAQDASVRQLEALGKTDDAAVADARIKLTYTKIVSPIDGRAGLRLADVGNVVRLSDAAGLAVITQVQPIALVFTIPDRDLSRLNLEAIGGGKGPALAVSALDRDNQGVLDEGTLAAIDNQIDEASGTIKLKAVFPNAKLSLWPGQFVNARLLAGTSRAGLVVPAGAVQQGPKGPFVYVVRPDLTAEVRPVRTLATEEGSTLIEEGVKVGERVVVDGQYILQPNSRVQVRPADADAARR